LFNTHPPRNAATPKMLLIKTCDSIISPLA
jgi:hypothetical protein